MTLKTEQQQGQETLERKRSLPDSLFVQVSHNSNISLGKREKKNGKTRRSRKSRPSDEHFISLSARQNKSTSGTGKRQQCEID